MLDKIITLYRKVQMGVISELSGATHDYMEEASFYDVGYMQSQISRIQKELQRVTSELETALELKDTTDYGVKRSTGLMEQREQLLFCMIYLASNSFNNLEDCVKLAEGHSFDFMSCVQALREYKAGSKDKAFQLLESYYKEHGSVEEHFLVNKVFGLLLVEKRLYKKAIQFLTYALQFVPDDFQCLNALKTCYGQTGELDRETIIGEVIGLFS